MKVTPAAHKKPRYPRLLLRAAALGAVGSAAALLTRPAEEKESSLHGIEVQIYEQKEEPREPQHTMGVIGPLIVP